MSKRLLTTAICMACALLAVADATDAQLREILHRAVCYIDDPYGGPGEVRYAIRLSGDNTNRVVSLMKQNQEGLYFGNRQARNARRPPVSLPASRDDESLQERNGGHPQD